MVMIGTIIQGALLFVSFFLVMLITGKSLQSGVPRFRVVFLSICCILTWIISFTLTLIGTSAPHALLWEMMSFIGMISTLFMFFIAAYEITTTPWV